MPEEVDIIEEEIEFPPFSVNKAWKGRRFISAQYEKWRFDLELTQLKNKNGKQIVPDWVEVELHFYLKNFGGADTDNFIKPFMDSLVNKGYIVDDRKVVHYNVWKHRAVGKEKIKFIIKKYEYSTKNL